MSAERMTSQYHTNSRIESTSGLGSWLRRAHTYKATDARELKEHHEHFNGLKVIVSEGDARSNANARPLSRTC